MRLASHIRPATVLAALLCGAAAVRGATVHKVDDTAVVGDLVGLSDGKLLVAVGAPSAPAGPTAKQATTRVTTGPVALVAPASTGPATTRPAVVKPTAVQTLAVPLADVAQVVLSDPPAPKAIEAVTPNAQPGHRHSHNLISALIGSVLGTDDDDEDNPNDAPAEPSVVHAEAAAAPAAHGPTTGPTPWLVVLVGGDRLHGLVPDWEPAALTLRPSAAVGGATVSIPVDRVAELWLGDPAEQAKARGLMPADVGTDDVAFVRKDPDAIVPVRGAAMQLAGDAVLFRYDGRDRRLSTVKLVGLVMGNRRPATTGSGGGLFTAKLGDGDAVTGQWVGLDRQRLTLRTAWGQPLPLSVAQVNRVVAIGGRLTFLSDLRPAKVEQVPFFGRPVPYRLDRALGGGPIRLSDGDHDKGIAVHARCALTYDLAGDYDRLRGEVGFEQPEARLGSAAIRVLADDGRVLFDAPAARGDGPPAKLDLDVTGVRRLSLVVDFGADGQGVLARVDWADARLLRRVRAAGREK